MKTEFLRNQWGRFAVFASALFLVVNSSHAALAPASVTTAGSSVSTTILTDQSTVVKFLADGTFTVPDGATARLLLVGGGGAGGHDCSGGGGGGGMIEESNVQLAAGTYTVTVGAGGQPSGSGSVKGGNGGNTVLMFGGTALYTAVGGGGGGSWDNKDGAAGGSGGGVAGHGGGTGGAGTEGQGYAAGNATGYGRSGGGGAGGPSPDSNIGSSNDDKARPGGAGGPGKASDITGEEVYYAGGGGGGGYNCADSASQVNGGIGGGGNGARNVSKSTRQGTTLPDGRNEYVAECGVDGLGGGGGGASNTDGNAGRPGGSGVLIVRLDPVADGPEPQISMLGVTDGPASAVVKVRLDTVGGGASSASFSYKVANSAAGLDTAEPIAAASDVASGATVSIRLSNLTPGGTTYVRILAENNLDFYSTPVDTTVHPHSCYATFTVAGYSGSALANFPVLVRLSADSPAGFSYSQLQSPSDGDDLCFIDMDGNGLPFEIDTWDPDGTSLVWVTLPTMARGTQFNMCWGGATSGKAVCGENPFAGYKGVWHMDSVDPSDSSPNGFNGTRKTANTAVVAGQIGAALNVPRTGNGDGATCGGVIPNSELTDGFTIEGWCRPTQYGGMGDGAAIFGKKQFISIRIASDSQVTVTTPGKSDHKLTGLVLPAVNTWWHLAVTFKMNTGTDGLKLYVNGQCVKTMGAGDISDKTGTTEMFLGNNEWDQAFKGDLDEMRLSAGIRSADWIRAEHDTVASTSFLEADDVVHAGASAAPQVGIVASSVECTNATFSAMVSSLGMDAGMTTPAIWADLLLVVGTEETLSSPAFAVPLSRATEAPVQIPASLAGLNAETVYYAQIRATNSFGVAGESRVVSFTTLPPGPAFTVMIDSDHLAPAIALSFSRTGQASSVTQITVQVSSTGDFDNPSVSKTMEVDLAEMPVKFDGIDLVGLPTSSTLSYRFIAENSEGFSTVVDVSAPSSIGDGNNVWSGLSEDIDDPNAYVFAGGLPAPGKTLYFTKPAGLSPVINQDTEMPSLRFTSKANESVDADYLGGFHSCGYNLSGSGVLTFTDEKPIVQASYGTNTISNPIRFSRTDSQSVTIMSVGGDTTWLNLNGSLLLPDGVANTKMQVSGQGNTVLGGASPDFMGQLSVDGGRLTFANSCAMTNVSSFYFSGDPTSMSNATGASLVFPRATSVSVNSGWQ